ncbi:DNA translocase FtsK [Macrococcus armenti]|uniref:DNA translocase FtsK n=1 Tax=Macrococcus armenti TaxID=2875764 RepID=UPI001CCA47A2|nr:DNA translocase FtsK [Macrococcus armenti]UBH21708.1 DNA translocase FtsK [Macrococcus armenti]
MSWFDKIFGETKQDTEAIRAERLSETENDVYRRPRGKFRFPLNVDNIKTKDSDIEHSHTDALTYDESMHDEQVVEQTHYRRRPSSFDETYVPRRQRRRMREESVPVHRESVRSKTHETSTRVGYKVETSPLGRPKSETSQSSYDAQVDKAYRVHQPKFKASEVPSAIYGTKSRKDPSNLKQRPPIVAKKVTNERPETPTYRKSDNTVNIENVYASQIVAEIRKEREKKLQRQKAFQEERAKITAQQEAIKSYIHRDEERNIEVDDHVVENKVSDDVVTLSDDVIVSNESLDGVTTSPIKVEVNDDEDVFELSEGETYTFTSNENEDETEYMDENIAFETALDEDTDEVPEVAEDVQDIIDLDETDIVDDEFEDVTFDEVVFDDNDTQTDIDEGAVEDEDTVEDTKSLEPVLMPEIKKEKVTPFNVVMTPSDKKRLMQQRQTSESSVERVIDEPQEKAHVIEQTTKASTEQKQLDKAKQIKRKGPKYLLPPVSLLAPADNMERDESWVEEHKAQLDDAFYHFNVPAKVENVVVGPSVTRFELSVEKGVKVSRITNLQDDIKMALAAKDVRIEAPIPGTSLVGVEVPNVETRNVNLSEIVFSKKMKFSDSNLSVALGARINNEPMIMDLAKMPHGLIAGATGSGKSVCINSILISLLYRNNPNELKLLLIDPKMVELAPYNDLPHLIAPVITDVKAATESLKWVVGEMERRYQIFADVHVRNITAYNQKVSYQDRIPKIVVVIDELADLMMMAPQDVEHSIARIAQKARAAGIHLILATQRPSVNVITGLIKANVPTRIAFMVSSSVDSRTILDSGGAEKLLGNGDMLYLGNGMNKPIRIQGSYISDREIDEVVSYIKSQGEPNYLFHEKTLLKKLSEQPKDELFNEICDFMIEEGHISTSQIQRRFQIGYNRAARIIDQLEELGYVSGQNGSKPRDVLITEKQEDY